MGTLVVTEFITLDGIIEAPGGGEHPRAGWTFREVEFDPAAYEVKGREQEEASALLLGRVSYEEFLPHWPSMPEFARYNAMPKYVVSTTLMHTDPSWQPTTILTSVEEVRDLRAATDGTILVHGSARLAQSLAAADLVDHYTLLRFPVLLGTGKRLFADGGATPKLRLTGHATYANGIQLAEYDVVRDG